MVYRLVTVVLLTVIRWETRFRGHLLMLNFLGFKNRPQLGDYLEWTHEFKNRDQEFTIAGNRSISKAKTEETCKRFSGIIFCTFQRTVPRLTSLKHYLTVYLYQSLSCHRITD